MNCQTWQLYQDGELNPYNLPTISFAAGESQTWFFDLSTQGGDTFDSANEYLIEFALANHSYRNYDGVPELYFSSEEQSANGSYISPVVEAGSSHQIKVKLMSLDTINLEGKYIYQVYMSDVDNNSEPIGQGFLYITHNLLRGMKSGS